MWYKITSLVVKVFKLNFKFYTIDRAKSKRIELEVQFENLYNQTSELIPQSCEALEAFKASLVDCCFKYGRGRSTQTSLITRRHLEVLKELQRNEDIVITRPDKGAGIVLLNKQDYIDKVMDVLADDSKFTCLQNEKECTPTTEQYLTKCLKSLKDEGYITRETFDSIKPFGSP